MGDLECVGGQLVRQETTGVVEELQGLITSIGDGGGNLEIASIVKMPVNAS